MIKVIFFIISYFTTKRKNNFNFKKIYDMIYSEYNNKEGKNAIKLYSTRTVRVWKAI